MDSAVTEGQSEEVLFTFTTTEGEVLEFSEPIIPPAEVTALASEEVLGRTWNAPAEDDSWHGM